MDGSKEVVLLAGQHRVGHRHTWGHQLGDATLHQLLRQLRVLQLVAYRHTLACPNQLWQIGVERMMGKTSHRHCRILAGANRTAALGQRDAQYLGSHHCVVAVGLIEVTTAEQQQSIGMLRLQFHELTHHRGKLFGFHYFLRLYGWTVFVFVFSKIIKFPNS